MTEKELAKMFDHTFLKAYATDNDFIRLCQEAKDMGVAMVAINSEPVRLCKELLKGCLLYTSKPGKRVLHEAHVYVDDKDMQDFEAMKSNGVDVYIQIAPGDKKYTI